jgi:outer membrane protein
MKMHPRPVITLPLPRLRRLLLYAGLACLLPGLLLPAALQAKEAYTLQQAVETALHNNFTIKAAEAGHKSAQEGVKSSRSAFGPVVGSNYEYARRQRNLSLTGSRQDKELFFWRASLTQNVFSGFSSLADHQKAVLQEESSRAGVSQARLDLIRTVQEHFFTYLKARQNLVSARDALERLRSQKESSQAFYNVGVSPRIEVLQAEVDVSTAESALLVAENAVETEKARLNTLLLLPIDADVEYKGKLTYTPFFRSLENCLEQAYRRRPDVIIAEKSVQIAQTEILKAKSAFYPTLTAEAAWGTQGSSPLASGSPSARTRFNEWTVGVYSEWPVFEWGKTLFQTRQATYNRSRVSAEAENLRQEVGFLIKERLLTMAEAAKRIKVAQKAVEQASEAYRMASARYRQQVGTMTDVLDAQAKLSLTEASLAGSFAEYNIALSSLYAAIGEENPGLEPR